MLVVAVRFSRVSKFTPWPPLSEALPPASTCAPMTSIVFFAVMAVLNIFVAYRFPTETWVSFKLFGSLGLTFVFVIAQALYLSRHIEES